MKDMTLPRYSSLLPRLSNGTSLYHNFNTTDNLSTPNAEKVTTQIQLTDPGHLPIVDVLVVLVYPTELSARFEDLLVDRLGVVVRRDIR